MGRKRHTAEQIICKFRVAVSLVSDGHAGCPGTGEKLPNRAKLLKPMGELEPPICRCVPGGHRSAPVPVFSTRARVPIMGV
jgi:hypothetical protein